MEIDHIIHKDVQAQINNEIENGCDGFPICFKDRLTILYGKEVTDEYDFLCCKFKESEKKVKKVA